MFVSIFPDEYCGGWYPYKRHLLSSSIFLFLLPLFLSVFLLLLSPILGFVVFPDTLTLPLLLGTSLSYTTGKASGFPASAEATEVVLERLYTWDAFGGSSSVLPTGICFSAAASLSVVKDFCTWQI